jgi:hypothetical protein
MDDKKLYIVAGCNGALLFDNSEGRHELFAEKQINDTIIIFNQDKFNLLKNHYDNTRNSN